MPGRDVAAGALNVALMCLFWGVAAPTFKVVDVHPLVRLSWRAQASLVAAAPATALAVASRKDPNQLPLVELLYSRRTLVAVLATGTALWLQFVCFNLSLSGKYATAFVHCCVLTQVHPQIIAACLGIYSLLPDKRRYRPSLGEAAGVFLGFFGVLVAAYLDRHAKAGDVTPPSVAGDVLAILSSVCSAAYALGLKTLFDNKQCPSMLVQFLVTIVVLVETLVFAPLACPTDVRWRTSEREGMLDWPRSHYLWPYICIIGATTIYGHTFMTAAMHRLPVILVSLIVTMIPVLHELVAYYVYHVASAPHPAALGGWVLVFIGLLLCGWFRSEDPFKAPATPSKGTEDHGGGGVEMHGKDEETAHLLSDSGTQGTPLDDNSEGAPFVR